MFCILMLHSSSRACGKCGKAGAPLARRLFQAAVGIRINKKPPKATEFVADFHSCGIFHRPFSFSFVDEFPLWKTGRVALRIAAPTASTVRGDFRARSTRGAERMLR